MAPYLVDDDVVHMACDEQCKAGPTWSHHPARQCAMRSGETHSFLGESTPAAHDDPQSANTTAKHRARGARGKRGGLRRRKSGCDSSEGADDISSVQPAEDGSGSVNSSILATNDSEDGGNSFQSLHGSTMSPRPDWPMAPNTPDPSRVVSSMYVRTKFCRFHGMGICSKGDNCTFAHTRGDLRSCPNFFRTKLCPLFSSTGACAEPSCKYAHQREQLRAFQQPRDKGKSGGGPQTFAFTVAHTPASGCDLSPRTVACSDGRPEQVDKTVGDEVQIDTTPVACAAVPCVFTETSEARRPKQNGLIKTKPCKFFRMGVCVNENSCNFAHGDAELRPLQHKSNEDAQVDVTSSSTGLSQLSDLEEISSKGSASSREELNKAGRRTATGGTKGIRNQHIQRPRYSKGVAKKAAGMFGDEIIKCEYTWCPDVRITVQNTFITVEPVSIDGKDNRLPRSRSSPMFHSQLVL